MKNYTLGLMNAIILYIDLYAKRNKKIFLATTNDIFVLIQLIQYRK